MSKKGEKSIYENKRRQDSLKTEEKKTINVVYGNTKEVIKSVMIQVQADLDQRKG